jgi:esterase
VELKWCDFASGSSDDNDSSTDVHTPVILLHGLLGSKRNFASIATSLASQLERKRRIIGLDLRNHGENHHDWREDMCYSEMAEDVIAFMDSQGLKTAILVGHSMGGKIAQSVALLTPDRVEGLVVLDIAPVTYTTDEPHWKAVQDIVQVLSSIHVFPGVTKREVDVQLREAVPDPALRAFCLTNLDVPQGRWKIHMQGIAAQLDQLAGFDIDAALYQYHGDVFIINGGQSRFVRHAYMESIQSYFPNHM